MLYLFSQLLRMSLVASIVILIILAARLLLRNAPRVITYALWLVVLFRLLCPWSPESTFSLVPSALPEYTFVPASETPAVETTFSHPEAALPEQTEPVLPTEPTKSISPVRNGWFPAAAALWCAGMCAMLVYSLVSLLRLRRRLIGAVHRTGNIYLADHIAAPFVLGVFRPNIYLPSAMSDQETSYILLHEQVHIRRLDHIWKLLGFLALSVHWFNPLVWLSYGMACRDMEISCDEAVLRRLGTEIQPDYSASLLRFASGKAILPGSPLAFGEGDTKTRIRHILQYRKPALWAAIAALVLSVVLIVVLALDPVRTPDYFGARFVVSDIPYEQSGFSFSYTTASAPGFCISENGVLYTRENDAAWQEAGKLEPYTMNRQARNALFSPSSNRVQEIMDDVRTIYRVFPDSDSKQQLYYYLLEYQPLHWNSSVLYLAVGHTAEQMRWLFRLDTFTDAIDLEYLEFAIEEALHRPEVSCFAVHEAEPGWLLVGWMSGEELGVMEFTETVSRNRRTYDMHFGVQYPMEDDMTEFHSWYTGPSLWQTEYVSAVTNNENLGTVAITRPYAKLWQSVSVCPSLTVLKIPYDAEERWFRLQESIGLISTSAEAVTVQEGTVPDEPEPEPVFQPTTPVYDLTSHAAVTLTQSTLSDLRFYTNSTSITVSVVSASDPVEIRLYDAKTDAMIGTQTCTKHQTVQFTNLTSAAQYRIALIGTPNDAVTVKD